MNFHRPAFSLKTLIVFMSLCVLFFWGYGEVLPKWNRYQQLQAAIRSGPEKSFLLLDEVVVNLASRTQSNYLTVGIELQVPVEDGLALSQKVENNKSLLTDHLITHLSGKTIDDVRSPGAIDQIRNEIRDDFDQILFPKGSGKLERIVFRKFMSQ